MTDDALSSDALSASSDALLRTTSSDGGAAKTKKKKSKKKTTLIKKKRVKRKKKKSTRKTEVIQETETQMCPVCREDGNTVNLTFLQCAHPICTSCKPKLETPRCPICRANIETNEPQYNVSAFFPPIFRPSVYDSDSLSEVRVPQRRMASTEIQCAGISWNGGERRPCRNRSDFSYDSCIPLKNGSRFCAFHQYQAGH
jgi:hypothetical protein